MSTQKEGGTGVDTDPTVTVSTTHLQERGALAAFTRGLAENLTLYPGSSPSSPPPPPPPLGLRQRLASPGPGRRHTKSPQHCWEPSQGCPLLRHAASARPNGISAPTAVAARTVSARRRVMASLANPRDISSKDKASSFHFLDDSSTSPQLPLLSLPHITCVRLEQPTEGAQLSWPVD